MHPVAFHRLGAAPVRIRRRIAAAALAAVAAIVAPAYAHHSAAMFDAAKTIEVKGAVKAWLWTNPHSLLTVQVRNAAGQVVDYSFEANGPGYLVRTGWKRDSLKPGDAVTVTANPLRDGGPGGNLLEVALANGHKLSARVVRAPAPAPGAAPAGPAAGAPQ